MLERVWKIVKTKAEKVKVAEVEEERKEERAKKSKEERIIEIKKVTGEQEIQNKEKEIARLEKETKKLVLV